MRLRNIIGSVAVVVCFLMIGGLEANDKPFNLTNSLVIVGCLVVAFWGFYPFIFGREERRHYN